MKSKNKFTMYYVLTGIVLSVVLVPYIWMILTSLKSYAVQQAREPIWIFKPVIENYFIVLAEKGYYRNLINNIIVSGNATVLAMAIGIPAAYAFSRFHLFGGKQLMFFTLIATMIPPIGLAFPLYFFLKQLNLVGTRLGLILAHGSFLVGTLIWVVKSFMDGVPRELDEAAKIDGAGLFITFIYIIVPLVKPGIAAVSIIIFIFSWNEFMVALILTSGRTQTLPVVIPSLLQHTGTLWGQVSALGALETIPIAVICLFALKYLVRGLTFGAVKQ